MKSILIIALLHLTLISNAQVDRLRFDYDIAGNQTLRFLCMGCTQSKTTTYDEISNLKEEDLLKFFQNDVISYYPNPVKEELFLKWELINENNVSRIEIFSMNGQLLKTYKDLKNDTSIVIPFQDLPSGTYSILLLLSNGEQKPITILKK